MSYRMQQITDRVWVGMTSDGTIDVEVWPTTRNAEGEAPEEIFIPSDATEALGRYLIKVA